MLIEGRKGDVDVDQEELKQRSKQFSLRVIRLVESLPHKRTASVIGHQLLRSGTSVGANYRAACRARSRVDFVAKLGIVIEEADECCYWMELLEEAKIVSPALLKDLKDETNQLVAIFSAAQITARKNLEAGK